VSATSYGGISNPRVGATRIYRVEMDFDGREGTKVRHFKIMKIGNYFYLFKNMIATRSMSIK